jgi:hypothetical protein
MQKGLPDIQSPESAQGTRLASYRAHKEFDRRLLPSNEQDLLRVSDQLEAQIIDTIGLKGDYNDVREIELTSDLITGHPDLLRVYTDQDVSVIIDDKFGWQPVVSADVNLQLRCYAILAPTSTSYVAISQPRRAPADRITIAKYDAKAKEAAREQIAAIDAATKLPDAPLVPGEEQCRYCRARHICPALKEAVRKELVVFDDLSPDLSKAATLGRIEARLAQANDTQLSGLYVACALARLVSTPLGDEIRRRIENGGMDGFELGKEIDVRNITNVRRAISLLVLNRVLTKEQLLDIAEIPLMQIEEEYRKATKCTAREAKAEINKVLAGVIVLEKRKPKILRKNPLVSKLLSE